jgi:hypothetical protein
LSTLCRSAAHGQQHGVHHLAAGEHDQSEELLHVRKIIPPYLSPLLIHFCHRVLIICRSATTRTSRAMVARKVLDGLRKGKKDVYALNIQYVKRY